MKRAKTSGVTRHRRQCRRRRRRRGPPIDHRRDPARKMFSAAMRLLARRVRHV